MPDPFFELAFAPLVIAQRLPLLWAEAARAAMGQAPSAGRPEAERMVTEKISALHSGLAAAQIRLWQDSVTAGMALWQGNAPQAARIAAQTPAKMAHEAAAPAARRVRANRKRLA